MIKDTNQPKYYNQKRNHNKDRRYNRYDDRRSYQQYTPSPETKERNKKIIKKVEEWQSFKFIKHLTCGNEGCDTLLVAKEINGRVVLQCPKCKSIQSYIPKSVLKTRFYLSATLVKLRSMYEWIVS